MIILNQFEKLEQEAFDDNVKIHNFYLGEENLKGLYIDGHIAINTTVKTNAEKACITAEELGHHYTTSGNIIDMQDVRNIKQERKARAWAYDNRIGLTGLIRAFERCCQSRYEVADFLGVTEEFLSDALNYYKVKYGEFTVIDHYIIRFIPCLMIAKMF